jgi:catechol 2,3-dioxygenase-like lactoylglutathione lyase family enzyme
MATSGGTIVITQTRYVIGVADVDVSSAFYRDVPGFEVREFAPGWRLYVRAACMIQGGEEKDALRLSELGDHAYLAYMLVDDIDDYFAKVTAAGAKVRKHVRDEPWGVREFALETIDGHRIMFGQPLVGA